MTIKNFFNNRLWKNNSSLVQLLGLCPVLAMTSNVVNALGLGIATTLVLTITNTLISIFKRLIPKDIRIPIYMMIISSIVTCIEMLLHAYQFELYKSLGVFIPLIVTNCIIIGRADFIAYKNSVLFSFFDGIFIGLGATIVMFIVGSIREIIGNGTLFFGINKILFTMNSSFFVTVIHKSFTVSLATLPPGGFFVLGMIIAFKNFLYLNKKKSILSNCLKCACKNTLKK